MTTPRGTPWAEAARDHLWMHFTRHGDHAGAPVPVIVRGRGCRVEDSEGRHYLDAISGLFVVQVGHGRDELVAAATRQMGELAYFPIWGHAHPSAIALAERLAHLAPGDLNRVFFTAGGGDSVDSAAKLAKQHAKLTGRPGKYKMISRATAYHGTPQGALALTGVPRMRAPFEPLAPGASTVPNTNAYRPPPHLEGASPEVLGRWAADRVEEAILAEGPDTVAAVFVEPVQNAGGPFVPPPGYFARLREICDTHEVLLVADETICAFGRLGAVFASPLYGCEPDVITCAKGLTSGYAPLGAMIVSDRLFAPFTAAGVAFQHGYTFGGHPVAAAVAMANLDVIEREDLCGRVRAHSPAFRSALEELLDIPIVGDVRGDGYLFGVELVRDRATKERFAPADVERLLRGFLTPELYAAGLYCRPDDRGDPVVQFAPPLVAGPAEFAEISAVLRDVLTRAADRV